MRKCKECDELKDSSTGFYGVQGECKECTKKRVKLREKKLRKDPKWLEKEQERQREKYHRLDYRKKHKPTYDMKKKAMDRYNDKFPEKKTAKNRSQHLKPLIQGNQLHHWSYNKKHYKDVIELSVADHNLVHRLTSYDQERKMYRVAKTGVLLDSREDSVEFYKSIGVAITE